MKLIIIFGAGAVGKMTVGQELAKITGLRLFHNHMTLELVIEIFGTLHRNVSNRLRQIIFEEFVKTDNYGMIMTYMWAFDLQSDWDSIKEKNDIFNSVDGEVYYVELVAPQEIRLERNKTENRLKHKASKRDLEASKTRMLREEANHRLVSHDGEITFENYIKIDNSEISPDVVAKMIKDRFIL